MFATQEGVTVTNSAQGNITYKPFIEHACRQNGQATQLAEHHGHIQSTSEHTSTTAY